MSGVATTAPEMNAGPPVSLRASLPAGSGTAVSVAAAWIALIAASGLYRGDFLSHQTILAVSFSMAIIGVLAVAQALVGISGGILDLSQPTGMILSAAVISN